jgi:hypothetical protein
MHRHDQQRFAKLVSEFIDSCGFDPPFHVIAISGTNGSVSVSRQTDSGIKEVCRHNVGPGMTSPVIVTVVSEDGRGKSAKIEIVEAARGRIR